MQLIADKPKINRMLQRLSIEDRLGAIIGSFQEASDNDIEAVVCKTIAFVAWVADTKLSATDQRHCAIALNEVAQHLIEQRPRHTLKLV